MKRAIQKNKGIFITFEGGEGAGKTTLMEMFASALRERGHHVIKTREPGGTELGEQIRKWLLDVHFSTPIGTKAELMLFLAARAQHIEEVIRPSLQQGNIVLCDRFNESTIAYQGGGRGLGIEYVQKLCEAVSQEVVPDVTFFLNINIQTGLARSKQLAKEHAAAGEGDRIESEEDLFHERVLHTFRLLAEKHPEKIFQIDATCSKEEVFHQAFGIYERFFTGK